MSRARKWDIWDSQTHARCDEKQCPVCGVRWARGSGVGALGVSTEELTSGSRYCSKATKPHPASGLPGLPIAFVTVRV